MPALYDQIQETASVLRSKWKGTPKIGIILGTGLGGLEADIAKDVTIPYGELPHFPVSTVESHAGKLLCGKLGGKEDPFTVPNGSTIIDLAESIHQDLAKTFKHARIWGTDVIDGQTVSRDHELHDLDVVEIHA